MRCARLHRSVTGPSQRAPPRVDCGEYSTYVQPYTQPRYENERRSDLVQMDAAIKCADCAVCLDEAVDGAAEGAVDGVTGEAVVTVCCRRVYCVFCAVDLTGTKCPCGHGDSLTFQPCAKAEATQDAVLIMNAHGIIREPVQTCPLSPCTAQISKSTYSDHLRSELHRSQLTTRSCPACTDAQFENEDMFVEHMIAIHISASVKLGGSIMVQLL